MSRIRKAWVPLVAGGGLTTALMTLTGLPEGMIAAIVALVTALLVYGVPNAPPKPD